MAVMSVEETKGPSSTPRSSDEDRFIRLARLHELLTVCPSDILSRCELAGILEVMEMYEEALANWNAVIECDANNLKAREGVARCHRHAGRHPQSMSCGGGYDDDLGSSRTNRQGSP